MSRKAKDKIEIEERIGYTFADKAVRDRALTHISALSSKSSRTGSYQRLEFLDLRNRSFIPQKCNAVFAHSP